MSSKFSFQMRFVLIALLLLVATPSFSQVVRRRTFPLPALHFPADKQVVEVPFEIESGLMVIPVSVNGSKPLRYVLDTGASGAIHNDAASVDSLKLKIAGEVQVRGVGGGGAPSTAKIAEDVTFNIGGIELSNAHLAVRPSNWGHSGAIGREVFANLVVEVDWEKQVIRLYEPSKYVYKNSGVVLPLTFDEGGRPYTTAAVAVADGKTVPVKVVVDAGASHALSLDINSLTGITLPDGATKAVLGQGASGEVTGHAGRIGVLEFGGQTFKNVPTSFPDSSAGVSDEPGRNGNLGSGILRRFKVIYDYSRNRMIVEPNKFVRDAFGTAMPTGAANTTFAVPAAMLPDYAGRYGNKEITVRDGGLYYQRIGGRGAALRAISKDKFALNEDAQITFVRNASGVVTEAVIDWVERDREQLKKEPLSAPSASPTPAQPASAASDEDLVKSLSAYLDETATNDRFSGAVLVAKNDQTLLKKAYGLANKEKGTPNNLETKFDLGSMNKMFTAVAIAQLAERGKLSFTDSISKYLPGYPNKTVADKVTIHQLLTHTSGMGSYFNDKFFANINSFRTVPDYLPLFANEPLAFEPGAKWQYSNSGFVVLGLIIEKISGRSYYDYVKENIFKPAGMNNTDSYERDKETPNLAIGYTRAGDNGRLDPAAPRRANTAMRPPKGSPAGGGYSTVDDLLKFSLALRDNKLLSQKYREIVTTGKVEMGMPGRKYAYGFGEEMSNGRRLIGHNGGGPGIGANFDMFPDSGYTIVVLGNYDAPTMMPVVMKIRELLPK